jgi:hypothetical protein
MRITNMKDVRFKEGDRVKVHVTHDTRPLEGEVLKVTLPEGVGIPPCINVEILDPGACPGLQMVNVSEDALSHEHDFVVKLSTKELEAVAECVDVAIDATNEWYDDRLPSPLSGIREVVETLRSALREVVP